MSTAPFLPFSALCTAMMLIVAVSASPAARAQDLAEPPPSGSDFGPAIPFGEDDGAVEAPGSLAESEGVPSSGFGEAEPAPPGSFFRSPEPVAEESPGFESPPPPFSPQAPVGADVPMAPAESAGLPPSSFETPATASPAATGFGAPLADDGTRSVLTSPPEGPAAMAPGSFGSPEAASNALPPAEMADLGLADSAPPAANQQTVELPTGPATELIKVALAAVEAGTGPIVLEGLATRPLPLLEALERSGDRGRRLWITQAYWNLVEKVAVLRWTAEAVERLEYVAPSGDPHDRAVLDVAVASRLADVAAARAALVSAQQELVDLVRLPATEPLPWPVDRPLATSYETHFDVLFASRIATGRIRAIARSLPLEHEEVDARAAAVHAAETALAMAENDHARGSRGIEAVIAAHAAVLEQQQALAKSVTRYNDDIVEYVMAVADFSVPDEQFATMLIGAPTPWRPAVTLTSATVPVGMSPTLAPPPAGVPAGAILSSGGFPAQ